MRQTRGFTLIELLVVVAIIVVLLAILMPSMRKAIETAQLGVCSSNHRQIAISWQAYASDHFGILVSSWTTSSYTAGRNAWVDNAALTTETLDVLKAGKLWPYLQNPDIYKCPSDAGPYIRSYSLNNKLGGLVVYPTHLITPVYSMSEINSPGQTMLSVDEYDSRGYNMNSFAMHSHLSAYKDYWLDYPAHFHFGNTVALSFADGHAESYRHQDPLTLTLTTHSQHHPNNPDLYYFERIHDPTNY